MAVKYKLTKNYGKLSEKMTERIVIVDNQTVEADRLARNIQNATALTQGDVVSTIISLKNEIVSELKAGNSVHLPGIGYFSIAAKGDIYEDPKTQRRRLRNVGVRTVNFRPDSEMMKSLSDTKFENITYHQSPTAVPTPEEIDAALDELFDNYPSITVADLRHRLHLSIANAYRLADRLVKKGKLYDIGAHYRRVYVRGEGE